MELNREQKESVLHHSKNGFVRFQGLGARAGDLKKAFAKIIAPEDWIRVFTRLARQDEKAGDEAVREEPRMASYLIASTYYHLGELLTLTDTEEKRQAFDSFAAVYLKAAPFFSFPLEKVEVPYGDITLPGYYRTINGIAKAPSVILVRGVDACREVELHIISNHFLRQGFFTLAVDLPGQGQARMRGHKMTPDFEKPVAAVVDYLQRKPEIDSDRIGMLGMSFGGYIAPRAAALESRIKACVSLGGFYGLDEFEFTPSAKLNCFNNMRLNSEAEWERVRGDYNLEQVIAGLKRPLLVVNGSEDKVIPASQSTRMHDRAPGPGEIWLYPGIGHCVYYEKPGVLTDIATWMKKQL